MKGILFDFDGTPADTMEGHYLAWRTALGEYGISIDACDYYPLEGAGMHNISRTFIRGRPWKESEIDELVQKKRKYNVEGQMIAFYPGVESLVSELKAMNIPMGIVTAGHLDQLCLSVPQSFLSHFNALITGDMVTRGKPDPEPFLKGAQSLGPIPQECITVENAPLGIQSARRANIYCIGVCSTVGPNKLADADEIVIRFADLRSSVAIKGILESRRSHA